MRSLLRLMQPDNFEDISAVARALPARARWAPTRTPTTRCARTASRRSPRSTPSWPSRSSEILGTTYGLIVYQEQVHGDRAEGRRLHPRQGRPAAPRDGQEEEARLDKQFERLPARACRPTATPTAAIKTLWDILVPVLRLRLQQGAHRRVRAGVVLDRLPQGATTRPSTWPRCSPASRDDKDKSALYLNECRRMGIKVLPPDVNESVGQLHRRRHRHPLRPRRDPQRRRQRRRRRSSPPARRRAAFTSFNDFLRKVPAVVCNKRTIESLIKAGAFDSLGHTRRALVRVHERLRRRRRRRSSARRPSARFACSAGSAPTATSGDSVDFAVLPPIPPTSGTRQTLLAFEREMLGLYVSDHPLFGLEHVLAQHADTSIATLTGDETQARRHDRHHRRADHRPAAQAHQEGQPVGHRHGRGPRRRDRVPVLPAAYQAVSTMLRQDVVCVVRGRLNRRDETPTHLRPGADPARTSRRARAARSSCRCRCRRRTAAGGRAAQATCSATHPGRHRGAPAAHPARAARR